MRRQVFIVTEVGEAYLGQVGEIINPEWPRDRPGESGPGESLEAALADIVATMIEDGATEEIITIDIREEGAT